MFPLSEVVLMIPRCVALSTDGMLLRSMLKVKLLDSCLRCVWEMFRTTLFVVCNSYPLSLPYMRNRMPCIWVFVLDLVLR